MKNTWIAKDTLIVMVLALVGIAVAVAIGGFRAYPQSFEGWLQYRAHEAVLWAIVGLIVGAGLGIVMKLISK
jgi:prolipoprotein diacylglyceryltransferase